MDEDLITIERVKKEGVAVFSNDIWVGELMVGALEITFFNEERAYNFKCMNSNPIAELLSGVGLKFPEKEEFVVDEEGNFIYVNSDKKKGYSVIMGLMGEFFEE